MAWLEVCIVVIILLVVGFIGCSVFVLVVLDYLFWLRYVLDCLVDRLSVLRILWDMCIFWNGFCDEMWCCGENCKFSRFIGLG